MLPDLFGPGDAFVTVEGSLMERVVLPFLFRLSSYLTPLAYIVNEFNIDRREVMCYAPTARIYTSIFLTQHPVVQTCRDAGTELMDSISIIEKWCKNKNQEQLAEPDEEVDGQFRLVVRKAKTFAIILEEELKSVLAFEPSQKLAYSTSILVEHAERVFPESVICKLDEDVVFEIRESGKSLVFDLPTAAVFHILRALERVLHQYYLVVCNPPKKDWLHDWGKYVKAFEKLVEEPETKESDKKHAKKVMALLDVIRDQDRNPVIHPRATVKDDDAPILFDQAKTLIGKMAERLPNSRRRS